MKRSASPAAPVYTCAMRVRGLDLRTGVVLCLWLGFGRYLTRLPGVAVAGSAWRLFLVASASLRLSLNLAICVRVSTLEAP